MKKQYFAQNVAHIKLQLPDDSGRVAEAANASLESTTAFPITNYFGSLSTLIKRVNSEPKQELIFKGIKENTVGFIIGPPKSAKTTFCENLGMAIASGAVEYLGEPIKIQNRTVLFISLEEYYYGRTQRNSRQALQLQDVYGNDWLDNFKVVTENIPRYITSDREWNIIESIIYKVEPGIVFIDSLSRLYDGSIEDSQVALKLMKKIREMANKFTCPIVIIHHTPKLANTPLGISSIAGSRILGQEADFVIGLNKTAAGDRYIKNIAFRYAPDDDENVKIFKMDENQWLYIVSEADENELLSSTDGRRDNKNLDAVKSYITAFSESEDDIILYNDLVEEFCNTNVFSKQSLSAYLKQLVASNFLNKIGKGEYSLVIPK